MKRKRNKFAYLSLIIILFDASIGPIQIEVPFVGFRERAMNLIVQGDFLHGGGGVAVVAKEDREGIVRNTLQSSKLFFGQLFLLLLRFCFNLFR